MKKNISIIVVVFLSVMILYEIFEFRYDDYLDVSERIEIMVPLTADLECRDTHGGFHMDGETLIKIYFSNEQANKFLKEVNQNKHWRKLPMTINAKKTITYLMDDEIKIPEIINGYWFFLDRHSDSNNKYDENERFEEFRPSRNYTVAIFDTDTNILYFYECDT